MSDLFWPTDEQVGLRPFFPGSRGRPRVDDRRVLSGIVFVNRNGLGWRDAPSAYGPYKMLHNRWKRRGERGVFTRMMEGLAAAEAEPKAVMPDATYLKAHRTASSLRVEKGVPAARPSSRRNSSSVMSRRASCSASTVSRCASIRRDRVSSPCGSAA